MDDIRGDDISRQRDTGNHEAPGAPDAGGADMFGGTRPGADNVEDGTGTNIRKGPHVSRVAGLDEALDRSVSVNRPAERSPERDERGRL